MTYTKTFFTLGMACLAACSAARSDEAASAADPITGDVFDTSFGVDGTVRVEFADAPYPGPDEVHVLIPLRDRRLYVLGARSDWNDWVLRQLGVMRLRADGTPDPTFGTNGRVVTDLPAFHGGTTPVEVIAGNVGADGKLLVLVKRRVDYGGGVALLRYDEHGQLDPTFGHGGIVETDGGTTASAAEPLALVPQPDGRFVVLSRRTLGWGGLYGQRFGSDGALDASYAPHFPPGLGAFTHAAPMVGGSAVVAVGRDVFRIDPEGQVDASFHAAKLPDGLGAEAVTVDPTTGAVVVAGGARTSELNITDFFVARLRPDGSLDPAFGNAGVRVATLNEMGAQRSFWLGHPVTSSLMVLSGGDILAVGTTTMLGAPDVDDRGVFFARLGPNGAATGTTARGFRLQPIFGELIEGPVRAVATPQGTFVSGAQGSTQDRDAYVRRYTR